MDHFFIVIIIKMPCEHLNLTFKSSSIQYDVHLVNYGPVLSKIDDKAGYTLGHGYLIIDKSPPWQPVQQIETQQCVSMTHVFGCCLCFRLRTLTKDRIREVDVAFKSEK